MSLKTFHIVFIVISTMLAIGFGVWAIREYLSTHEGLTLGLGIASFASAVGLVIYGVWFLRKLRHVSFV